MDASRLHLISVPTAQSTGAKLDLGRVIELPSQDAQYPPSTGSAGPPGPCGELIAHCPGIQPTLGV